MKITIAGTGMVGMTIATKLTELGHTVIMATRNPEETIKREKPNAMTGITLSQWLKDNPSIQLVSYEKTPPDSELIINATSGHGSLEALKTIGTQILENKILLDISNPLDFSKGMPPSLFISNTDSLAEQIQSAFPLTKVVKSLNTLNAFLMVNPKLLKGPHTLFLSGNDKDAKSIISSLLTSFGWESGQIIDLGDITTARGTEMMLPIWVRLWQTLGHANFNFYINQGK